tara:strand:- start:2682 stop:3368 length:687 start_codon:yes stop_codon:yes gene_type:complete
VVADGGNALMHDKFAVIDDAIVFTGSWDLSDSGVWRNNNNLVIIYSVRMAENFGVELEEMFGPWRFGSGSPVTTPHVVLALENVRVGTYSAPEDGVAPRVLCILSGGEESMHFMAFCFTRDDFGRAREGKVPAGITVAGVAEEGMLFGKGRELFEWLQSRGVAVLADGNRYTMHHKVLTVAGETVVTGSYNFSAAAEEKNDENVLFMHSRAVAGRHMDEFMRIWRQAG